MKKQLLGSLILACALAGCGNSGEAKTESVHSGEFFPLSIMNYDGESIGDFQVEIADSFEEHSKGLMHRTHMDKDKGMLFIWDKPARRMMWMKNTNISLDMLFIKDETVLDIALSTVPHSEDKIGGRMNVDKVLELSAGTVKAHGIQVGHTIEYVK